MKRIAYTMLLAGAATLAFSPAASAQRWHGPGLYRGGGYGVAGRTWARPPMARGYGVYRAGWRSTGVRSYGWRAAAWRGYGPRAYGWRGYGYRPWAPAAIGAGVAAAAVYGATAAYAPGYGYGYGYGYGAPVVASGWGTGCGATFGTGCGWSGVRYAPVTYAVPAGYGCGGCGYAVVYRPGCC
ncbi:hypothetical protein CCR97_25230 [Rhodoplanes elegans]|uniref:Sulfur globule protein n=1 Tax=Rhodoplanes elegans TaxID=29408 RepID=A0A327KPH0_9BRAD|nr:hypothetical protein [Rhodoplanes elegans]MBK5961483.1 hypothetical protein [Rhodoplanes elegans]RAI39884.1 hypothetical protein CH338_07940 [Rhodoplanes elegans]